MTDPLLTIEDATREFRVSPKTIRRRLAAGEIEGAYKRPGSRGPEWVMPRTSLAAAGFVERSGVGAVVEVPAESDRRADYWERRAKDAEDALAARTGPLPKPVVPERRRTGRVVGPLVAAAAAVLAVIAVAVVLLAGGDDPAPRAAEPMDGARGVLSSLTAPGDEVGFLGPVPTDVLPPERHGVPVREVQPDGPRYLVAVVEGDEVTSQVQQLLEDATTVLRMRQPDGWLLVFDTAGEAPAWAAAPTTTAVVPSTTAPPAPPLQDLEPSASAEEPGTEEAAVEEPGPATPDGSGPARPTSVVVGEGESFWSIATEVAEAAGRSSVEDITEVWAGLIDANADRLVEPGNPDLLHVGQTLIVPSR